jgi:hypothetical protein
VAGFCEHGFHKERLFFDKLSDNQLFKYYSASWSEYVSKYGVNILVMNLTLIRSL